MNWTVNYKFFCFLLLLFFLYFVSIRESLRDFQIQEDLAAFPVQYRRSLFMNFFPRLRERERRKTTRDW